MKKRKLLNWRFWHRKNSREDNILRNTVNVSEFLNLNACLLNTPTKWITLISIFVIILLYRSSVYPELMVASYDKNTEYSAHDPDGVCLVWNTRFKKNTPEHVFHCQSPVTVTTFAKFHPHLIIGGTYSGQVWIKLYFFDDIWALYFVLFCVLCYTKSYQFLSFF